MKTFSAVDIANIALGYLQQASIQSFDQNTAQAIAAKRYYDLAVASALSALDWGFARSWRPAVPVANADIRTGWSGVVVYPNDALKIRGIATGYGAVYHPSFEVGVTYTGQKVVYVDRDAPVLVYTRDIDDPLLFDPLFVDALGYTLAAKMATSLGKSLDVMRALLQQAQNATLVASAVELNEGARQPKAEDPSEDDAPWISAR